MVLIKSKECIGSDDFHYHFTRNTSQHLPNTNCESHIRRTTDFYYTNRGCVKFEAVNAYYWRWYKWSVHTKPSNLWKKTKFESNVYNEHSHPDEKITTYGTSFLNSGIDLLRNMWQLRERHIGHKGIKSTLDVWDVLPIPYYHVFRLFRPTMVARNRTHYSLVLFLKMSGIAAVGLCGRIYE